MVPLGPQRPVHRVSEGHSHVYVSIDASSMGSLWGRRCGCSRWGRIVAAASTPATATDMTKFQQSVAALTAAAEEAGLTRFGGS